MLTKTCPSCGSKAELQDTHLAHDLHSGHILYEAIHKSRWLHAHPVLAGVGMAGLGVAALMKMFEKHHYKCGCGHHFKA